MSRYFVRETFFRPETEFARETSAISAGLHNRLRLLLGRTRPGGSLFVPIRSMQYLAVVEHDEIVFVDALGGYAHQDGEGGRLIRLAWRPAPGRESLSAPVPCDIIYYVSGAQVAQKRLMTELGPALQRMLERQSAESAAWEGRVLPFRNPRQQSSR
ncbi:hypothetical protein [Thiocystis violascens]|uniref:Uncharacterized protein n=1 Tax=Thiocystis violascens (strain ATCC 17096 / DSM 198 / 6111) TaxID=765911 RepID=I3YCH5_THIV6|nr:hypothetical protein [Thiocystis violascens]AFL74693.1 hypothetical protein Thivi_2775 [Thiocystis violascens DSM 198]